MDWEGFLLRFSWLLVLKLLLPLVPTEPRPLIFFSLSSSLERWL
jgi:hypothetical protein